MYEMRYGSNSPSTATILYNETNWQNPTTIDGYWTRIGSTSSSPSDWTEITAIPTPTKSDGTYNDLKSGGNYSGYTIFPSAGHREGSGLMQDAGSNGTYLSASVSSTSTSHIYNLGIRSDMLIVGTAGQLNFCFPVRCLLVQ
jgi:hypothetical protein